MSKKKYAWTGSALAQELQGGKPLGPVYYIFGDDPYQIREIKALIQERVQPAFRDFNFHQVTGGEVPGEQIAALANQLPVMDTHTVVIVREAQLLQKGDWTGLVDYLDNPSETTCLAFFAPERTLQVDSRTKAGKLIKKFTVGCLKPFENKMPQWIKQRAKSHKLRIDQDAIYRLLDLLGTELTSLDNALERLSLYLGGKGDVDVELVNRTIAGDRDFNVFELAKFVGQRNIEQALRYLRGILNKGEHPLKLLALLVSAFRKLIKARVEFEKGAPLKAFDQFVAPQLRYQREQHIRAFVEQVKMFTLDELREAFFLMEKTDLSLKSSSGLTDVMLMEKLILDLCQLRVHHMR